MIENTAVRRQRAYISEFGTTLLHLKNPWIVAFWSFAFPGCGTLMQGRVAKGLILICWELIINTNSRINLSIMYSLLGQFDMAIQVINTRWFLLYVALYVYALWDSYRGAVDLNKQYILADREDVLINPFTIKTLDTNYLDKRSPWLATVLSVLSPGLGHLYVHKVMTGLFFIAWTILVIYISKTLPAVHYTFTGNFGLATSIVNMQWLMYLPSIYGFVIHDSYITSVEYNKLTKKAQSRYLRANYQRLDFQKPMRGVRL
ncbi:hypothetical protein [Gracilibacillus sp. YIM 98692]|uniref:hypothetical protein n=1 Tax=Gracilibacillus sp. YIM 98692 TaxID=2663532 RepID=UPI0013D88ED0|nr:hypothetical protein [Gracilibacillus sp. YIM 98692]